jgi:hypothetical protein
MTGLFTTSTDALVKIRSKFTKIIIFPRHSTLILIFTRPEKGDGKPLIRIIKKPAEGGLVRGH